jgi:hypothetical protein
MFWNPSLNLGTQKPGVCAFFGQGNQNKAHISLASAQRVRGRGVACHTPPRAHCNLVPLFRVPFVLLSLTSPVIPGRSPMFFLSVQSFCVPLVLGRPLTAHSSTLVVTARLIEAGT